MSKKKKKKKTQPIKIWGKKKRKKEKPQFKLLKI